MQLFLGEHGINHHFCHLAALLESCLTQCERIFFHNVFAKQATCKLLGACRKALCAYKAVSCLLKRLPTPSFTIGAGNLDFSVKLLFAFGDFVAAQIPDAEKKWKFFMRRNLCISWWWRYIKRGFLILDPSTGAVQVCVDCVKLELTDQMLPSNYDARLRLFVARPHIVRIRDTKIDFELTVRMTLYTFLTISFEWRCQRWLEQRGYSNWAKYGKCTGF